jgi:hypothetical protein
MVLKGDEKKQPSGKLRRSSAADNARRNPHAQSDGQVYRLNTDISSAGDDIRSDSAEYFDG